jgi:hypothetical protein
MRTEIVPRPGVKLPELQRSPDTGMTACRIAGIALGAVVLGVVLSQVPDIIRYVRMTQM